MGMRLLTMYNINKEHEYTMSYCDNGGIGGDNVAADDGGGNTDEYDHDDSVDDAEDDDGDGNTDEDEHHDSFYDVNGADGDENTGEYDHDDSFDYADAANIVMGPLMHGDNSHADSFDDAVDDGDGDNSDAAIYNEFL